MHGRLKVRTTEEQKILKQKEQQKKLFAYREGMKQILSTRSKSSYEKSSLDLSANLLVVNPDIYTLWNYRKEVVLQEIEKSKECEVEGEEKLINFLENEIKLTEHCLLNNPKSYGSWHHRFWVLEHHPKPNWSKELVLCNKYFTMDDRNFHCWDYRRLIIGKIGVTLTDELKFSLERINTNFSNYSSWHYRSTLRKLDKESIDSELKLVQSAVFTDPMDTSAWFYFRWVLSQPDVTNEQREKLADAFDQLLELDPDCKWILLAKCWLTGSLCLKDKDLSDNRSICYKKLEELDPLRKGMYLDLQMESMSQGDVS